MALDTGDCSGLTAVTGPQVARESWAWVGLGLCWIWLGLVGGFGWIWPSLAELGWLGSWVVLDLLSLAEFVGLVLGVLLELAEFG